MHRNVRITAISGAGYVEFLLVAPLALLIVFGVVELGRLMSQHIWFAHASMQAAMMGSISPKDRRLDAMTRFADDLFSAAGGWLSNYTRSGELDPSEQYVAVEMAADLTPLVRFQALSLKVRSEMAVLLDRDYSVGNLNSPENPPQFYDCSGQPLQAGGAPCTSVYCALSTCP